MYRLFLYLGIYRIVTWIVSNLNCGVYNNALKCIKEVGKIHSKYQIEPFLRVSRQALS